MKRTALGLALLLALAALLGMESGLAEGDDAPFTVFDLAQMDTQKIIEMFGKSAAGGGEASEEDDGDIETVFDFIGRTYDEIVAYLGAPSFDSGDGSDFWTRQLMWCFADGTPYYVMELYDDTGECWSVCTCADYVWNIPMQGTPLTAFLLKRGISDVSYYVEDGLGDFALGKAGDICVEFVRNRTSLVDMVTHDGKIMRDSWLRVRAFEDDGAEDE